MREVLAKRSEQSRFSCCGFRDVEQVSGSGGMGGLKPGDRHTGVSLMLGLGALAVFLGTSSALAGPTPDHDITVDDYFTLATIGMCAVSPDGDYVAFTESRWAPPAETRNTDLWLVNTTTKALRRLTFDKARDGSPTWSPDGKFVYFTSNRKRGDDEDPPYDGKKQVWRISPAGGEPLPVTAVEGGIGLYELSRDGRALYYTTSHEVVDAEWKELQTKYAKLEYGHGVTEFSQLWVLDLESWRREKIVDEQRVIRGLAVSPDRRRVAMMTTADAPLIFNEGWSRVDIYDARGRTVSVLTKAGWRKDHPSPHGWIDSLSWSDTSGSLAFTVSFDGYPTQLYIAPVGTGVLRQPSRGDLSIVGGSIKWRPKSSSVYFIAEDHGRARVYAMGGSGLPVEAGITPRTPGDVVVSAFDFNTDGSALAVVMATPEHPHDVFRVSRTGGYDRLTTINPQVETWKLPQLSLVSWKGANGDEVQGVLELPPDYKPGEPLPMVVEIHGGPTAAAQYFLRFWIYGRTLLPAKGYALLSPNYRGSTGYGDKFMTDLIGHENGIEVEDILKGVDAMVSRGIADPDRLAVMGWSNGGFLTNCLITTSDRFKAASSGAGVIDQVIQWGVEDTPGHVINYMRGLPWSNPEAYRAGSPLYNLAKVKTATLIHVGAHDARVPVAHSRTLYRGLRHYLHVPVQLVVYPGEGHGLTKYTHRKAKMEWDLAWFHRYLGMSSSPSRESASSTN